MAEMTAMMVLKTYFGYKLGQTLQQFAAEIKALSAEQRAYLAEGAAKELGVTIKPAA